MRGRGRGRGFASRGVLSPPNPDDIIRRFKKEEGGFLIDLINGRDAEILGDDSIRLYTAGDTDIEYTFFNKSDRLIWKTGTGGDWTIAELEQQAIYDNIQDAYKYILWCIIKDGKVKDLFLYSSALIENDICKAKNYVKLGETYDIAEAELVACKLDKTE